MRSRWVKFVRDDPRLWKWALGIRDVMLRGPWRDAIVAYHRFRRGGSAPAPTFSPTLFPGLDVDRAAEQLRADGFAMGLQVPAREVDEIVAYCSKLSDEVLDDHRNVHLHCPAADRVARDERLVAVARRYLGVEPILFRTAAWIRHAYVGEPCFHFDSADVKDLLIFIYLTDVDEDCMPHAVIPGTHRTKSFRQVMSRELPDEEAQELYGDRIKVVVGPRGTGFFEDTTNYHKRMGGTKSRLSLVIIYTLQRPPQV